MASHLDRGGLPYFAEIAVDQCLEEHVAAPVLVHERGRVGARLDHVDDRGQFLVVGEDLRSDVLGFGAGGRHAHGDRLAYVPHLVLRQRPQVRSVEPLDPGDGADRLYAVHVGHREDAVLVSRGLFDAEDPPVGDGRTHEGDFQHAGALDVPDELAAPAQVAIVLLAPERGSDALA